MESPESEPRPIQTFCRPKSNFYRKDGTHDDPQNENCLQITDNEIVVREPLGEVKTFTDVCKVFDPSTSQANLYEQMSTAVSIADVVNGFNSTIVAYGQTGAGKTYTIVGDVVSEEKKGIIPRTLETVFASIDQATVLDTALTFTTTVSYVGIYLEEVTDLLSKDVHKPLEIKQHVTEGVYIKDLSSWIIRSPEEGMHVLQQGMKNRLIGITRMGQCSSRMHTLFYINVYQRNRTTSTLKTGRIILVDLAGSERQQKTGASGMTLRHATIVGLSQSALGNVITALSSDPKKAHIPYRDSRITRLLQDSLGGTTRTAWIACVNTCVRDCMETIATLRYANRVRKIVNHVCAHSEDMSAPDSKGAELFSVFDRPRPPPAAERCEATEQADEELLPPTG